MRSHTNGVYAEPLGCLRDGQRGVRVVDDLGSRDDVGGHASPRNERPELGDDVLVAGGVFVARTNVKQIDLSSVLTEEGVAERHGEVR